MAKRRFSLGKAILFSFLAVFFSLTAILIVSELIVRAFKLAPGLNRVSVRIHRLTNNPIMKYEMIPWSFDGIEAINGMGLRDFTYSMNKPRGVFRIAVLGDSTTYGWGSAVWQTHPRMLEYYLNQFQSPKTVQFEVWNFGVRGYGTVEELECCKIKALPTHPDMIILGYYLNDPDPYSIDLAGAFGKMEWKDEQFFNFLRESWNDRFRRLLFEKSQLYILLKYRLFAKMQEMENKKATNKQGIELHLNHESIKYDNLKSQYFYTIMDKYWSRVEEPFKGFKELSEQYKIPVVVLILPCMDDFNNYQYEPIHKRVTDEASKNGLMTIDPLPLFIEANKWNYFPLAVDYNHPNMNGNRIIGWKVATQLMQQKKLPVKEEQYGKSFFDFNIVKMTPDRKIFMNQDMYQIEMGLRLIYDRRYSEAVDAFLLAKKLNPDNQFLPTGLREIWAKSSDPALHNRIKKILNSD